VPWGFVEYYLHYFHCCRALCFDAQVDLTVHFDRHLLWISIMQQFLYILKIVSPNLPTNIQSSP